MKRKTLALLLCAALLLTACTAAPTPTTTAPTTVPETTQPFDLAGYKKAVQASVDEIADGRAVMEYAAALEAAYLKSLLSVSATVNRDKLLEYAEEKLTSDAGVNFAIMAVHFDGISSDYKGIVLTEISGSEAQEIDQLYRGLYLAYSDLYRLATDPTTDLDKLTETREAACESIDSYMQQLNIFLK